MSRDAVDVLQLYEAYTEARIYLLIANAFITSIEPSEKTS